MSGQVCWRCAIRLPTRSDTSRLRSPTVQGLRERSPFASSSSDLQPRKVFSTAGTRAAGGTPAVNSRGPRTFVKKKGKIRQKGYKVPAPGERKALRKRVVLSNSNALEVDGLRGWPTITRPGNARGMAGLGKGRNKDGNLEEVDQLEGPTSILVPVGKVVTLPNDTVDILRALESFKPNQGWGLFRRPSCLIREATKEYVMGIEIAQRAGLPGMEGSASKDKIFKRIIVGERGTGKSVLLLQAHTVASAKGWVVIHIPEGTSVGEEPGDWPHSNVHEANVFRSGIAQDLTTATTAYSPIANTKPQKYLQKDYTAALLSRIAKANRTILSKLIIALDHPGFPLPLQSNISLERLAQLGATSPDISWQVFEALWAELTIPNNDTEAPHHPAKGRVNATQGNEQQKRPPLLLTLDSLAHASRLSRYLTPSMHYIHAHDLAILDHFFAHLKGDRELPNGGAVIAADSNSNRPKAPSLDLAIRLAETSAPSDSSAFTPRVEPVGLDPESPYDLRDPRVLASLHGVPVTRLQGVSGHEAQAILEYYAKSGIVRERVTDGFVSEMRCLSGGGVVGELERSAIRH